MHRFAHYEKLLEQEYEYYMENDFTIECPDCEGEGYYDEECDRCGHDREKDCDLCDATGEISSGEVDKNKMRKLYSYSRFIEELEKTVNLLTYTMGKDIFQVLSNSNLNWNINGKTASPVIFGVKK